MKNIFSSIDIGTDENAHLSTEMISPQPNDYVVPAMNKLFGELLSAVENFDIKGKKLITSKQTKLIISRIESLIMKRFGLNVKFVYGESMGAGIFPVLPKNYNVLNRDVVNTVDDAAEQLKRQPAEMKNTKAEEIVDVKNEYTSLLNNYVQSINKLDNYLTKHHVYVDLKKAHISNLPDDITFFNFVDMDMLVGKYKMTEGELTAVMLHEIGHAFTHIEYSYRTVNSVSTILDAVQENINIKNMSPKEALVLSYREDLGGDEVDVKDVSVTTGIIKYMDKFMKSSMNMTESAYSVTDSENLADTFAGRMGVSADLATGLDKLINSNRYLDVIRAYTSMMISTVASGFLMGLGYTMSVFGGLVFAGVLVGIVLSLNVIFSIAFSVYSTGTLSTGAVYDGNYERIKRIKLGLIRQLRIMKLPKDVVKGVLGELKVIESIMIKSPKEATTGTVVDKFMRNYTAKGLRLTNLKELDQTIEALIDNELHVGANQLKMMKGK